MENERSIWNRMSPFLVFFMHRFIGVFAQTMLVFAIVGILITRYAPQTENLSTLFTPDLKGLTHSGILQLAGCSMVIAVCSTMLLLDYIQTKVPFFFRFIIMLFATLTATSIFAVACKWYPFSDIWSWLLFLGFITAGYVINISFIMVELKLEEKKYNRLLKNYKAQHADNLPDSY